MFIQNIFHNWLSSLQTAHGSHPVHYCMLPSVRPAWAKKQLFSTQLEGCLKGSFHEVYFKGDCCHTVCIQVGQMYSSRSLPVLFSSSVWQLSSPSRESDGLKPTRPQLIARYWGYLVPCISDDDDKPLELPWGSVCDKVQLKTMFVCIDISGTIKNIKTVNSSNLILCKKVANFLYSTWFCFLRSCKVLMWKKSLRRWRMHFKCVVPAAWFPGCLSMTHKGLWCMKS